MGSSRLPGKVLMDIGGRSVLDLVVHRLGRSDVDTVVVATSDSAQDDAIARTCDRLGVACVRRSGDGCARTIRGGHDGIPH